ncbi:MAG: DUF2341 domain-containing protein [Bacteroidota bacterium]
MKKIFTILIIFAGVNLVAQPSGWLYNQPITVTNPNSVAAVNYQLKITVNTQSLIAANKMNAFGNDIRFAGTCTSSAFFYYWIEAGINTPTTAIWVKIPLIAANTSSTIFMFYGNPGAPAVSTIPNTFRGPNSSTDSVSGGTSGGLTQCQRGFRFAPNQNLLVTHFGKNEPSGTTRYVTLFNYGTQAIISQTQVSGPAASYSYGPITQPVWLNAGTQYVLQIFGLASDGYYFGPSSQIGQHLTYFEMQYSNGGTQNTFPTNTLANYHYGYGDFLYYITNTLAVVPSYTLGGSLISIMGPNTLCSGNTVTLTTDATGTFSWNTGSTASLIVVAPSSTSNYSVSESNLMGCNSNAYFTLNVISGAPSLSVIASPTAVCAGKTITLTASGAATYTWTGGVTNAASYTPAATSGYTVTGTNACGTGSAAVTITVDLLPNITASINNPTVCNGSSIILNGGGSATGYTWTGGATNNSAFIPNVTTNYTVTGASASGCTATAVTGVTVLVTPTITPVVTPTAICLGGTATLSASGATGYTWMPGSNPNTPTLAVSPPGPTTYTVLRTNGACSSSSTVNLIVNPLPLVNATGSPNQICAGSGINFVVLGPITNTWMPGGFTSSNFTLFPNNSTCYTVTGSNGNCTASAVVCITVNTSPVVSIISSTNIICQGGTVNFTAGGNATSYTWQPMNSSNLNETLTPPTTTIVSLVGTNAAGCTSTVTQLIQVNQLANMGLSSNIPLICEGQTAIISVTSPSANVSYNWSTGGTGPSISVNPVVTTTYYVTGTNNNTGCQNSNSLTLAVYISTFTIASPAAICKGETATLTASGPATSYSWSANGGIVAPTITVNPIVTTVYNVIGTNGSCSNTKTVSVLVNPLPNVTASVAKSQICKFEIATITANGATSYSWNTGATSQVLTFTLGITTTYTITGTDGNGCSKTTTVTQFVATCIGVEDLEANGNGNLSVYPNPNNGNFFVKSDVSITLTIVNSLGQIVSTIKLVDDSKKEIAVSNLANGIYFIKGEASGMKVNKKIVVEK